MKKIISLILIILLLSGCASRKYTIRIVNNNGELLSSFEVASGENINNIDDKIVQIDLVRNQLFAEVILRSAENSKEIPIKDSEKYAEALGVVVLKDPKSPYKWKGHKLGEILSSDKNWLIWAKDNLLNEYLLKYVKIICEHDNL